MEILAAICFVLFICLILAMRWVVSLLIDLNELQTENMELTQELLDIKHTNSKHKKQQLND